MKLHLSPLDFLEWLACVYFCYPLIVLNVVVPKDLASCTLTKTFP